MCAVRRLVDLLEEATRTQQGGIPLYAIQDGEIVAIIDEMLCLESPRLTKDDSLKVILTIAGGGEAGSTGG